MYSQPAVYMSQEQINALFSGADSVYEPREDRSGSFKNELKLSKQNEVQIQLTKFLKTESGDCDENRHTTQSENIMMITREEYMSLQGEYERRKDMEEKYKEDINELMKGLHQKQTDAELIKKECQMYKEQAQNREEIIISLRQQAFEANNKEQKAIMELSQFYEQHLQLKQQFDSLSQKYNSLVKQSKFEIDRKERAIDQLKTQIISCNEELEKIKSTRSFDDKFNQFETHRQEYDRMAQTQNFMTQQKSSILFQKEKPTTMIQCKSNYESKITFSRKPINNCSQIQQLHQNQ